MSKKTSNKKTKSDNSDFKKQVRKALTKVRPALKEHGGNVRLIEVDEKKGVVKLRLQGMCVGCPMADITLQEGIGDFLRQEVKGVKEIEAV